jgi:hypothetical protein
VTGRSWGVGTAYDYATIKYYPNGDTAWMRRYNGLGNSIDEAYALAVDGSGNVYVTGESFSNSTSYDYATIKYYPNGDIAWVRTYNGQYQWGPQDYATAIAVDGSGNVYVTGRSWDSVATYDYATIKYYPNGDTAWVRIYDGPGNGPENRYDQAWGIAVDNSGNVYVTGSSEGSGVGYDYATIKYYPNGETAWVRRYNGSGNYNDNATAIVVDRSRNVYVTGQSWGSGTGYDYATIKYNTYGDAAWVRRYNGPGNLDDGATAIAVDGSGNVYVTGHSYGNGTYDDYATIKYYPNGDTAWIRRYNGPDEYSPYDDATAIEVDSSGNVYVAGHSVGSWTNYDYAIIKYYPNGDTAWVRRYNGQGYPQAIDEANAIAVDGSGNVYVTGQSIGSGTAYDYATIKYKNVPVYSITGKVMDGGGLPLIDSLVFLVGDRNVADTSDSSGDYEFSGLPEGNYKVFRDSLISVYIIHLTSDTTGFNFRGYSDINDLAGQQTNSLSFALSQNYPNPFNQTTKIEFTVIKQSFVSLQIYDLLGRKVRTLVSEQLSSGLKSVTWDGKNDSGKEVASGVYFYQLKVGDFSEPKKMLLLK